MKTFKKFQEELAGLGDMNPSSDQNNGVVDELRSLLFDNSDKFKNILNQTLRVVRMSGEEENLVKKLIGLIGNIKEKPKKLKTRDPLSDIVARQASGSSMSNGDGGGEE